MKYTITSSEFSISDNNFVEVATIINVALNEMWWLHATILLSIFVSLAVTSWQLIRIGMESLSSCNKINVLHVVSLTNSKVRLYEHVVPVMSWNLLLPLLN